MQMGKMDKESVDKMLNEVGSYVNRGINLSKKLLMFSRSEKPDFQIGDLNRIIMETDGLLKHLIPANIKIEYELSKDKLLIEADSHQIEQVLINLVVNASDAMPDGGQIFISTSGSKKKCIMKVSDTGTGMNKSTIDKIFEPFYTTKEKGKGTGLGLSVVHGILNQHNAKITVKSAIGKGSEFCVEFARQANEEEFEELKEKTAGKIFRGSGEKILVIEDTEDVRISLKEMLASIGYDVETAENAEEGEKMLYRENYDIMITDYMLPGMNGMDLAEKARSICGEMKVLIMSGYADNERIDEANEKGYIKFMQKPFDLKTLSYQLKECLKAI